MSLLISPLALAILESLEEFRPVAYQDPGGRWTAGYGHTGPDVVEGTICTLEQGDIWLQHDLLTAEAGVSSSVIVPITQRQFDALTLFTFNVGVEAEAHSTLCRLVNARDPGAADEFLKWSYIHKVPNTSLAKRRRIERALYLDEAA